MAGAPNRIRELRSAAGMSLDVLSDASGVARNSINLMERGDQELTLEKMRQLGRALGVPPSALLNDEDVEYRPAQGTEGIADVLRQLPRENQVDVTRAAKALVDLARNLAVRHSAGAALDGDDDQIDELVRLWNSMDNDGRARALALLSASGFAEPQHRFTPARRR